MIIWGLDFLGIKYWVKLIFKLLSFVELSWEKFSMSSGEGRKYFSISFGFDINCSKNDCRWLY